MAVSGKKNKYNTYDLQKQKIYVTGKCTQLSIRYKSFILDVEIYNTHILRNTKTIRGRYVLVLQFGKSI